MGAAGLALPYLFHLVGGGPIFLPMYLPVLVGGFLLSPVMATLLGLVLPPLSVALTGMPPPHVAPLMMAELASLGVVASLLYRRLKLNFWLALFSAIFASRVVGFFVVLLFGAYLGIKKPAWVWAVLSFVRSLPGTGLQIVVTPMVVKLVERRRK